MYGRYEDMRAAMNGRYGDMRAAMNGRYGDRIGNQTVVNACAM